MESNVTRLTYVFLLCVWLVICHVVWDSGLLKGNGNNKPLNLEEWMNLAPSVMSLQSSAAALFSSEEELEKSIIKPEGMNTNKKKEVEETHLRSQGESAEKQQLTPEQEEKLKDLIDFTLGDEIDREDLNAEEIQGLLNLAIADAQEAFGKLNLRREGDDMLTRIFMSNGERTQVATSR